MSKAENKQSDTKPKIQWSPINQAYIITFWVNGKEKVTIRDNRAEAEAFVERLEKGEAFW